jgi:hypothetical protein
LIGVEFIAVGGGGEFDLIGVQLFGIATIFGAVTAAGAVDQDEAHGLGGGAEKVGAILEDLAL